MLLSIKSKTDEDVQTLLDDFNAEKFTCPYYLTPMIVKRDYHTHRQEPEEDSDETSAVTDTSDEDSDEEEEFQVLHRDPTDESPDRDRVEEEEQNNARHENRVRRAEEEFAREIRLNEILLRTFGDHRVSSVHSGVPLVRDNAGDHSSSRPPVTNDTTTATTTTITTTTNAGAVEPRIRPYRPQYTHGMDNPIFNRDFEEEPMDPVTALVAAYSATHSDSLSRPWDVATPRADAAAWAAVQGTLARTTSGREEELVDSSQESEATSRMYVTDADDDDEEHTGRPTEMMRDVSVPAPDTTDQEAPTAEQPIDAYVYLECGHVQGRHPWGKRKNKPADYRKCPLCSRKGYVVRLKMGFESSFWVDNEKPTHAFDPCGHMASEKTIA